MEKSTIFFGQRKLLAQAPSKKTSVWKNYHSDRKIIVFGSLHSYLNKKRKESQILNHEGKERTLKKSVRISFNEISSKKVLLKQSNKISSLRQLAEKQQSVQLRSIEFSVSISTLEEGEKKLETELDIIDALVNELHNAHFEGSSTCTWTYESTSTNKFQRTAASFQKNFN